MQKKIKFDYERDIMEFDFAQQPGMVQNRKLCDKKVTPMVSIITPYYNGSKYFNQTFNCVINQTFPWFEWIIVDDGSRSEELAFLKKTVEHDTRIKVYTKSNGGPASARNYAIDHTNTDIIVSLDADDLISPTYIETTYWALYFNADAGWAYTDSLGFDMINYTWKIPFDSEKLKRENFLIEVGTIRKRVLIEVGKYDDREKHSHEDWRLWLQILSKGYCPVHIGYYGAWYRRIEDGSFSKTINSETNNKRAHKKIKEVSDTIKKRIEAIEYPLSKTSKPYYKPRLIDFGQYDIEDNADKVKILLLVPWMTMGGADKFNLDYIAMLDKDKFDISLMSTVNSDNEWRTKYEKYTDKIYSLPDFLDPAYYLDFIGYYILSKGIDVVFITNSYKGYYMLPWLRKNFPQISIIDYVHMEEWYWREGGYARVSGMMGGFIDRTYVCNSVTRDVMIKKFDRVEDSVKTMYIGVDAAEFDRNNVNPGYLYRNYNISDNKDIIIFPCRIHPQKRPFLMLDIAERVYSKNKNALFVVVGDGEQLEELKNTIQRRKLDEAVICIGRSENMKECYRDAKLTLICSLKEGLALTAYESCAMGVPVISSDVGGQKDLIDSTVGKLIQVKQDEKGEFDNRLFDASEIQEFADAILLFLEDAELYEECSKNCRKKIENTFSTKLMSKNMEEEILALISNNEIKKQHLEMSQVLQKQGKYAEEFYTNYLVYEERDMECGELWRTKCYLEEEMSRREREGELGELFRRLSECEVAVNRHEEVVNRHEEVVNRHEEVVNRHEEVVNRHEEVVNRHEQVVNDDWAWLKNHEERINQVEKKHNRKLLNFLYMLKK